jgi:hypothetical protein
MATITCTPSGTNSIIITVHLETGDVANWWINVRSKQDHGKGGNTSVDYPYNVEYIPGTQSIYTVTKTYTNGNYAAELNIQFAPGDARTVDFCLFDLGTTQPPPTNSQFTFRVVGNGQIYIAKNNAWIGTAITGLPVTIPFTSGDSVTMNCSPDSNSSFVKLCDVPQTECITSNPTTRTITASSGSYIMEATFSSVTPPPPTGNITVDSVSWANSTLSSSRIRITARSTSLLQTYSVMIDGIIDTPTHFISSLLVETFDSVNLYPTNVQHPVCIGTSCKTLAPSTGGGGCPTLNVPSITLNTTSVAPGGSVGFTATASGGQTSGDAYIFEVYLDMTTSVHTSQPGMGGSYPGTFIVPSYFTAGIHNVTVKVKDSCASQQSQISVSKQLTVTGTTPPPTNDYGCYNGVCTQGKGTMSAGCPGVNCVTLPPTNTSSCNGTVCSPTGGSLSAGCPGTPCATTLPPTTGCIGINIPIIGCQDKTTIMIAGAGILILMMTMMKKGR